MNLSGEIENSNKEITESQYEDGLLIREIVSGTGPVERREYEYRNRKIKSVQVYHDDTAVYTDGYLLDSRGRIIRVVRSFPDESEVSSRYGYSSGELTREWFKGDDREELFVIKNGEIRMRESRIRGDLDFRESWVVIDGETLLKISYPRRGKGSSSAF